MLQTRRAYQGMVTAPHYLAARAGQRVLAEGGNAIEAMLAACSTIAVVYPHMNGLGGDNFWLFHTPGSEPAGIDACGGAADAADTRYYLDHGDAAIPARGPRAALTVAGAVSGWQRAFEVGRTWGGRLPLARLLEDAVFYAEHGFAVSASQSSHTAARHNQMADTVGFHDLYMPSGRIPVAGELFRNLALAETLKLLVRNGLDDFYRGELARRIGAGLQAAASPLGHEDLKRYRCLDVVPLCLALDCGRIFNLPPPTQGLASLILLGVFDRLGVSKVESFDFVHSLVEATKQAIRVRDAQVTDPDYMPRDPAEFLTEQALDAMAADIDRERAAPWPHPATAGDTVWLGAIDATGRAVSMIQSLYWEFGSGVVLPDTGITWQNRGCSFALDKHSLNELKPRRRPFHTIQPPLALLNDGRTLVFGTMGGDGQPQTQAVVFTRHVLYGQELQAAITAPRWLLGRTWGTEITSLRMESRFDVGLIDRLRDAGHDIEVVGPYDELMGHAGAVVHHPSGLLEGASDPRSDGEAAGF